MMKLMAPKDMTTKRMSIQKNEFRMFDKLAKKNNQCSWHDVKPRN